jgi:hypothetical protein
MEVAIFVGFLILLRFIIKNTKTYKIILAIILMLAAVPACIFTEIGVNGCCGAPSTGFEGMGYALMAVLFITGLALLILTLKFSKK